MLEDYNSYFNNNYTSLYDLAKKIVKDNSLIDEILNETYLTCYNAIEKKGFTGTTTDLRNYISRSLKNNYLQHIQKQKRNTSIDDFDFPNDYEGDNNKKLIKDEYYKRIYEYVEQHYNLIEKQIFYLIYIVQMPMQDVANTVGMGLRTTELIIERMRVELKQHFKRNGL